MGLAIAMVAINGAIAQQYPLQSLLHPSFYGKTARDAVDDAALRTVPKSASVAAQNPYLPHLAHREHAYIFSSQAPETQFIVIDTRHAERQYFPNASFKQLKKALSRRRARYRTVFSHAGVVVLERR
jgi:uncharacterized membrane protein